MAGAPSCSRHPETRATATCERCLAAICEICSTTRGGGTLCVRCVRDRRQARERRLALLCTGVIVAAIATPLVYRALRAPVETGPGARAIEKAASVVEKTAPVLSRRSTELSAAVDKEPCDRSTTTRSAPTAWEPARPRSGSAAVRAA